MKKNSSPSPTNLMSFVCATVGHDYVITRKVTNHINEYCCKNCRREVTDTYTGEIELLTAKIRNANSNVAAFFVKRAQRISA